jgi:hypothetical protein
MKRGSPFGWIVTVSLLTVLFGTAAYLAFEAGRLEYDPNRVSGTFDALWLVLLTMLACGLVYAFAALTRGTSDALATPLLPLVGVAAVCVAAARFYSYDDYAFPSLDRVSQVTDVPAWSLAVLLLGAVVAGIVAWAWPRAGLVAQGLVLWVVPVWIFFVGPFR